MANYVILVNWTAQGIEDVRNTTRRATEGAGVLKKLGGKLKSIVWTVGPYDAVLMVEAPDDETVASFCLAAGLQGNVRTTTMRAFDRAEMSAVLERLP